jgi:CheY-like chemotaxis protein
MHIPHIFVAEDSEYNQILFAKMLDQLGYSSSTAKDGKQLLQLLETSIPNLLLLDMEMPVMDGFEIIRLIRQGNTGADANLPVIALTGNYKESLQTSYKEAGFSDWISKPFSKQTLKDKIDTILNSPKINPADEQEIMSTDSSDEEPLYSLKYLREGSDGDEEFLKMMIGMFVESTPMAIQMMYDGLSKSDWDIIRQEAHKLRSHLRYFGMIQAAVLTEEIERTATHNPTEQILKELLGKVNLICQTCIHQLRAEFHL